MLNFIFHPIQTFNMWRLNRWVEQRRKQVPQEKALRNSFLSAKKVDKILSSILKCQLGSVGCFAFDGKKFGGGTDWSQLTLVLCSLADISTALPEKRSTEIKTYITELTEHNWGGVRRAALEAIELSKAAQCLK